MITLSASTLNLFRECPRCFWLQKIKGIHRPPLNFALQSNFDRLLKLYFDRFRETPGLPPELEGKVEGRLFRDQALLERWRNALRPTLRYEDERFPGFALAGGIDDCLEKEGYHLPVDYKTTGGSNFEENSVKYYQPQLDIYTLLLERCGYKTKGLAYLVYYKPEEIAGEGVVRFRVVVKPMATDMERAQALFEDAVRLLKGSEPKSHSSCQFCLWNSEMFNLVNA